MSGVEKFELVEWSMTYSPGWDPAGLPHFSEKSDPLWEVGGRSNELSCCLNCVVFSETLIDHSLIACEVLVVALKLFTKHDARTVKS